MKHSAVTLWRDTAEKAEVEDKIPVVCLVEKGKAGFWVMCHSDDLVAVAAVRAKQQDIRGMESNDGE